MIDNLLLVAPVFAIVALGWVAARIGWFTSAAIDGVDRFVFNLAISLHSCLTPSLKRNCHKCCRGSCGAATMEVPLQA
ncbi:MAG: hypothetical protein V6Z81_00560 [Parvularculales bacterium]